MSFERAHRRRGARSTGHHEHPAIVDVIERHGSWLLPVLLALVTFVAFLPTFDNGFVNWDDDANFLGNANYRGLGPPQLRWMLTTFLPGGHYIPLTWLTFGLDYVLWGMNPVGYHLTNLLLHVASVLVFYAVAVRLLAAASPAASAVSAKLGGALAAVFFAIHPLRVESVAWATERRDVLCGLFYLLAVLAYLRASEGGRADGQWRRPWYWAALGWAALALLSKSMAVSLPVVLLVLDVYPLARLGGGRADGRGWWAWSVWLEKVPFVLLSGAASVTAVVAMARNQAIAPIDTLSVVDRAAVSVYSLVFYLGKMAVPLHLSPLYALPQRVDPLSWPFLAAGAIAAALSVVAILWRRRWPGLLAVWVSYISILLPVLAIVQAGPQLAADRYTYLAGLGWALLVGGSLAAWWARAAPRHIQARRTAILAGAGLAVMASLGALTWRQVYVWHDPSTLWSHALATHPSAIAHYNLGVFQLNRGDLASAMDHFREALAVKPSYAAAHNNLGVAFAQQGDLVKATAHFRQALAIEPDDAETQGNLGNALARQGDLREAAIHLRRALALEPGDGEAHKNLGNVLAQEGRLDEALQEYREAVKVNPGDPEVYANMGMALSRQGRRAEAIEQFRRALTIQPGLREAQASLDELLAGNSPTR
jgi:protein O-mannosyl-transferase